MSLLKQLLIFFACIALLFFLIFFFAKKKPAQFYPVTPSKEPPVQETPKPDYQNDDWNSGKG